MAWYLAYGEDMDEAVLRRVCPSARKVGIAKIPFACLEFRRSGNFVIPTIVSDDKQEVWGVLYFVEDLELAGLPDGAPRGRALRFRPVWDTEGRAYHAYLLLGGGEVPVEPPSELSERLLGLAVSHQLPDKYTQAFHSKK